MLEVLLGANVLLWPVLVGGVEVLLQFLGLGGSGEGSRWILGRPRQSWAVTVQHVGLGALLFHRAWVIDCVLQHLTRHAQLRRLVR